nr:unnamed protein product [Digitaria exilis]
MAEERGPEAKLPHAASFAADVPSPFRAAAADSAPPPHRDGDLVKGEREVASTADPAPPPQLPAQGER